MTSRPSATDAVRIRGLAARTLETHNRRRHAFRPVEVDLDAQYGEACLQRMAANLPAADVACLVASSRSREQGLRLCRDGGAGGRELLAEARGILAAARLSDEAKVVAESFQQPAEAYLHYRLGKPIAARRALIDALGCCRVMEAIYGYEVEARRVHLARNVARVERVAGDRTDALHLALRLVRYIDGEAAAWPLRSVATTAPPPLTIDEQRALLDQLWGEISDVLHGSEPGTADLWSDPELAEFRLPDASIFRELRAWLDAMEAFRGHDAVAFLERAETFFAAGPVVTSAWHELGDALVLMSADL
jgi:hypothetical protein